MIKYKFRWKPDKIGYELIEDGHTMFPEDVVKRFDKLNKSESEVKTLKAKNLILIRGIDNIKSSVDEAVGIAKAGFFPVTNIESFLKKLSELLSDLLKDGAEVLKPKPGNRKSKSKGVSI